MRTGAGRKPIPLEERRRNRLVVNLNDHEYTQLLNAAGEESPSTFARKVLARYLARRRR